MRNVACTVIGAMVALAVVVAPAIMPKAYAWSSFDGLPAETQGFTEKDGATPPKPAAKPEAKSSGRMMEQGAPAEAGGATGKDKHMMKNGERKH